MFLGRPLEVCLSDDSPGRILDERVPRHVADRPGVGTLSVLTDMDGIKDLKLVVRLEEEWGRD